MLHCDQVDEGGGDPPTSLRRYKVVNFKGDAREIKKGFAARNLEHLFELACRKFKVPMKGSKLVLEDGTEVDEDDYFSLLPDDTLFVLVPPKEKESFHFWKVAGDLVRKVWRLPAPPKDDLMNVIESLAADEAIRRKIQDALDRTTMNLEDSKSGDPDWFQDLKTNISSKEAWMTKNAKYRVRSYYIKSKDDVEKLLFCGSGSLSRKIRNERHMTDVKSVRLTFDRVFDAMRNNLDEGNFYGGYFGRRSERRLRLCDDDGWFPCQGHFDRPDCTYVHRINPYGNRMSRILFSTWNLDHVVERSRSIVPSLAEAIREVGTTRPPEVSVNWKYFHELLFVARGNLDDRPDANLKLVHTVCHIKAVHKHNRCDKCKYFSTLKL